MTENSQAADDAATQALERCYCPVGGVLDLLSRKYAIRVVCAVGALQPVRYGAVEEAFGEVSSSTLSARLRELVDAGLLDREQYDAIPPRVEYSLTDDGEALCTALNPLLDWAEEWDAR
ncbi:MAG: winged helix-turn-helix transcriptional regulator [Haloglomus sp.]